MLGYLPDSKWGKILVGSFYICAAAVLFYLLFSLLLPVLLPFLLAWGLAFLLDIPLRRFCRRTRLPRRPTAMIFTFIALAAVGFLLFLGLDRLISETRSLVIWLGENGGNLINDMNYRIQELSERFPMIGSGALEETLDNVIGNLTSSVTSYLTSFVGRFASALPTVALFCLITVIASFYMSVGYPEMSKYIIRHLPEKAAARVLGAKNGVLHMTGIYARAYLILLTVTFLELLCGFMILGVNYAVTAALVIALVDILPVFGTGTVLIPWSLLSLIMGNTYMAFGLLILFAAVSLIRQIMEPRIIGRSLGLNPLVTLAALYIGLKLFGVGGMIMLPLFVIISKSIIENFKSSKAK